MASGRAFVIVLDSVGIGAAPDAATYGDEGASTIAHVATACGGLSIPVMRNMGIGNIPALLPSGIEIAGVAPTDTPSACYGAMRERSRGKDTTTGHWEIAGLLLEEGFALFPPGPPSFPASLVSTFEARTGRPVVGNRAASGTAIIQELGPSHMRDGSLIVYTSGDSVFQVAAHEAIVPLPELYRACEIARELCTPLRVGRVIARPFVGTPGNFVRTDNRRDYSYPLPETTILDALVARGIQVTLAGKLDDVFNHRGFTRSAHAENSASVIAAVLEMAASRTEGLIFANLIDFDMRYGHRRDPSGYGMALREADAFLGRLLPLLNPSDLLVVTADHGNDPTFHGTDHTREFVPLLVYRRGIPGESLGIRDGFYDTAQSLADFFGLPPWPRGVSFL